MDLLPTIPHEKTDWNGRHSHLQPTHNAASLLFYVLIRSQSNVFEKRALALHERAANQNIIIEDTDESRKGIKK